MKLLKHSNRGSFESLCKRMVEEQIKIRGVCNENLIQAMLKVERHFFVSTFLRKAL